MGNLSLHEKTKDITNLILEAKSKAFFETSSEPDPEQIDSISWPVKTTVGPGLEGAIACETKIGYVNGRKGSLIYRGYNIFDLCAYSTYEEVSFLLLYGHLPNKKEYDDFNTRLKASRDIPNSLRLMMGFPVQDMTPMAALRVGVDMLDQRLNWRHLEFERDSTLDNSVSTDEDAIPQEDFPRGEERAIYEFKRSQLSYLKPESAREVMDDGASIDSCVHLISAMSVLTAAVSRIRKEQMPIEWRNDLSHAANFLYMLTGRIPTPVEERIMDVALILHADNGMNSSAFASMVVASTLSDIYFSVGAGLAALNGPLHAGANEQVIKSFNEIGSEDNVKSWFADSVKFNKKIKGFGHRVYKVYDPRARILAPLTKYLGYSNEKAKMYYSIADKLHNEVSNNIDEKLFANVDYYSGIVYSALGIPEEMFTSVFAMARTLGWTARVLEYLETNRIFRPRAMYTGGFEKEMISI